LKKRLSRFSKIACPFLRHTVVEAAHIVPWSKSHNNDIRNGMALCRLCHWGLDEGMLGVFESQFNCWQSLMLADILKKLGNFAERQRCGCIRSREDGAILVEWCGV